MASAAAVRKTYKSHKAQLYFGFADCADEASGAHTLAGPLKKKRMPKVCFSSAPRSKPISRKTDDFQDICILLYNLAQKYVSRTDFADRNILVRCAKLFADLGLPVEQPAELHAHVKSQEAAVVKLDPQYRLLRNRAIAGLATVADLASKAPGKGSLEYQRGMRDAFQQASDIAALFLEDVELGV